MVLYRKYRPQNFSKVIGQEKIMNILQNEIKHDDISHAYLFTGPRGLGKTTTARLFAKSLNCLNRKSNDSEPCNKCDNCQSLNKGNFLDLIELDAASQTGVDNIRNNVISNAKVPPRVGKYKIFVIDEVHMLSTAAFNALLKTLEEPPENVKFIFATTEIRKVPVTVLSRCQRFDLRRIEPEVMISLMRRIAGGEDARITDDALALIVRAAEGSARDATSLLDQAISHGGPHDQRQRVVG